jgi:hypothetical protein
MNDARRWVCDVLCSIAEDRGDWRRWEREVKDLDALANVLNSLYGEGSR